MFNRYNIEEHLAVGVFLEVFVDTSDYLCGRLYSETLFGRTVTPPFIAYVDEAFLANEGKWVYPTDVDNFLAMLYWRMGAE